MRRGNLGRIGLTLAVSTWLTWSCKGAGPGNDGDGNGAPGPAAPAATGTFLGQWTGKYVNKDRTTSLDDTPAHATFAGKDNKAGTFVIELTQVANAFVSGSFTLIDQTSMMIDISKSTISSIGLAGTQSLLNYRLLGNTLELSNELVRLVFAPDIKQKDASRDSTADTPQTPNPNGDNTAPATGTPKDQVIGSWTCSDRSSNQWRTVIRGDNNFSIEISSTQGSRGSIWLTGSVTFDQETPAPHATLKVTASAAAKYIGMQLTASSRGQTDLTLLRVSTGEEIPCTRS